MAEVAFDEPAAQAGRSEVKPPLVLDVDNSLLRTDLLLESLLLYLKRNPHHALKIIVWGLRGRAVLKDKMAVASGLRVENLPVNAELALYAEQEAQGGREIHIATAADTVFAHRVARRFPFVSRVFASDGVTNLKGEAKARTLTDAFPNGFSYAGDSRHDMPIFRQAHSAVLVNIGSGMTRQVQKHTSVERVFSDVKPGFRFFAKVLRLHQWAKNGLVFLPLLLAGIGLEPTAWLHAFMAFIAMGLVASGTYLINDLWDLEDDRQHPTKAQRAIASGRLAISSAMALSPILIACGFALAFLVGVPTGLLMIVYCALTLSYTFGLKRMAIIDVTALALLFTIRLGLGVLATQVRISPWLMVFSMFLFLSLSLAKRHTEVQRMKALGRDTAAGRGYRVSDEPLLLTLGLSAAMASVVVLVLYLITDAFDARFYTFPAALWSAPVIMFMWLGHVWLKSQRGELHDDPVAFALKDRVSLALGGLMAVGFLIAVFGASFVS